MLERLHISFERIGASIHVLIDLLIVDQGSDRSLALVDLGRDRIQIARRLINVVDRSFSGVEHFAGFIEQIGDLERRLALNRIAVLYLG